MYAKGSMNKLSETKVEAAITLHASADLLLITGNPTGAILDNIIAPPGARTGHLIWLINISEDFYFINDDPPPSNIDDTAAGLNLSTNRPMGMVYNRENNLWYPIF